MGLKPKDLQANEPASSGLGQWHANLTFIDRRKTLLFVNDRTLFNFIIPDVTRSQIRELPEQFRLMLSCVLSEEAIPEEVRHRILVEYNEIGFAKSSSRSVLGSSNDIAFHYKYLITEAGGVHSWRVPEIIRELNRMPMQAITHTFPIDELAHLYGISV
jgi:Domain of unknown function (DUF6933)